MEHDVGGHDSDKIQGVTQRPFCASKESHTIKHVWPCQTLPLFYILTGHALD
jgi:hypothetical protein